MVRIVSWNCSQGLARKADRLLALEPDIAVVPEAGREVVLGDGRLRRVGWAGRNPTKGLSVFVREGISAKVDDTWDTAREWYLPVRVDIDGGLNVLAIWAMYENSKEPRSKWIRTLSALQHYRPFLSANRGIVIGDFNNNARWDTPTNPVFNQIATELAASGYESVHHARTSEPHGQESVASFFHRRDRLKPYLIDHAFIQSDWLDRVEAFEIGRPDDWLELSDHMPLVLDLRI